MQWDEGNLSGMPLTPWVRGFLRDLGHSEGEYSAHRIAGDGSARLFWRIHASRPQASYVVMQNAPKDAYAERENMAYLHIGRHLRARGIPIPEIHRFDPAGGWFILEDLGDLNLQEAHGQAGSLHHHEAALEVLLRLQSEGVKDFDPGWTCQTKRFDRFVMRRYESDYFRDAFLCGYLGLKPEWPELTAPFEFLAERASGAPGEFLLHRDFQSRNIMICGEGIGVLDWQGARLGPLAYDVASLVIDPYTDLPPGARKQLLERYAGLLHSCNPAWAEAFQDSFPYLALQRNLQILGAFSFLSRVRGKRSFEVYIPRALRSLEGLLREADRGELAPLQGLVEDLLRGPFQDQDAGVPGE